MKQSKPEWYSKLKQEPFLIRTFDTEQSTKVMLKILNKEKNPPSKKWAKMSLLASALLLVLVFVPTWKYYNHDQNTIPKTGLTIVHPEPILDEKNQILYLDPNWRISSDLFKVYQSYTSLPKDNVLVDLEPIDIFKLLLLAIQLNNEPFQKQLLVQNSIEAFPREKVLTYWEEWEKNYYISETIKGETAYISLTPDSVSNDVYQKNGVKKIQLLRSTSGLWQIEQNDIIVLLNDLQ